MAVAPKPAVDLCTLADVTLFIGGDLSASQDVLQMLITAISAAAATYCSRKFIQASYVEAYDGTGTAMLLPQNSPITAVASLSDGSRSIAPGTPGGFTGFVFDAKCLYLLGGARFCKGVQNIVVSYTAGYLGTDNPGCTIPDDLREAVVEAVADRFKKRSLVGIQSKTIAGETITYTAKDFPPAVLTTLKLYRRAAYT